MLEYNMKQMALIHTLKKKIERDHILCSKAIKNQSTWKLFHKELRGKKLVLYGMGEMAEYFFEMYGKTLEVAYAIDKKGRTHFHGEGTIIREMKDLTADAGKVVVLVTVVNGIDEIFGELRANGITSIFSLPVMEYHRLSVFMKVAWARWNRNYTWRYQMQYEIKCLSRENNDLKKLRQRTNEIQKRQTERYFYLLHTNYVLNALIDKTDDIELKKEQMRYLFTEIFKNSYEPDFENPKTYNEKTLAANLYDHNPLYTEIADKYTFKKYVADRIGEKYVVPLLGVWDEPEEIDFEKLPEQFVIKSTSGGDSKKVILVNNKENINWQQMIKTMKGWKGTYRNDYYDNFNWQFKDIKQRFIAEELLDIDDLPFYDFKVHCFHGEPKFVHVVKKEPHELAHYDIEWNRLHIVHGYPDMQDEVPKPDCLDEMIQICRKLAEPFKYIRVDFYVLQDRIYVGELTLTSMGGIKPFEPVEVDYEWGSLI